MSIKIGKLLKKSANNLLLENVKLQTKNAELEKQLADSEPFMCIHAVECGKPENCPLIPKPEKGEV